MVARGAFNPEVPGSNLPPGHKMDLSSVLVSLPPVVMFQLYHICLLRAFDHCAIVNK